MPGRSSSEREALSRQNAAIMAVFERAGFDHIAPDIIQPADIFLERSGEDIRARTFVFNDPEGNELCLRPDLTVPACRYHLSHVADASAETRYCYLGPAFRFPDERLSPQEFTQAGLEWFGGNNPVAEEARVLKLAIAALEAAGLSRLKVTIGDLGLFSALLDDIPMPERWRRRLRHQFWRPQAFRELLNRFAKGASGMRSSISPLIDAMAGRDARDAMSVARAALDAAAIPLVGGRPLEDVAARLEEKRADRSEPPMAAAMVRAIENYLRVSGATTEVMQQLKTISPTPAYAASLERYATRLAALEDQGLNPRRFAFNANFGRELEYYTGFVFQIAIDTPDGEVAVCGGGRYDDLLLDLGAQSRVPAVGCAIHTERVKAVLA